MPTRRRKSLRATLAGIALAVLAACPNGDGLSGTWEAKDADGGMTLEFKGGGKVTLTMSLTGAPGESKEASYVVDGNKVTIQPEGGIPLVLVKNGNQLDANMMGEVLHFTKK